MKTLTEDKPTSQELQHAIEKAKGPPYNLKSGQIKHTDHGAGIVRHHLPKRFHTWPLDQVRLDCEALSKAGDEPGQRKRTAEQKQAATMRSLARAFPSDGEHSEEYAVIHRSDAYRNLRDALKKTCKFICQGCGRQFMGYNLEGHIIDYDNWDRPGMMLILCKDECHPILDALRRRGQAIERGADGESLLFTGGV